MPQTATASDLDFSQQGDLVDQPLDFSDQGELVAAPTPTPSATIGADTSFRARHPTLSKLRDNPLTDFVIGPSPTGPDMTQMQRESGRGGGILSPDPNIHPIPRVTAAPASGKTGQVLAAVKNIPANLANSVAGNPLAFALPGGKLLSTVFALQMASDVPAEYRNAKKVVDDPKATLQDKIEAVAAPIATSTMAGLSASHAASGLMPERAEIPPGIAAAAKALPKTAAEVLKVQPPPTTEEPNAGSQQKTAEVGSDVRPQPVEGQQPVPQPPGGGGIQPQTTGRVQEGVQAPPTGPQPETLRPAIKVNGTVYPAQTGETDHLAIITRLKAGPLPDLTGQVEEGFVGKDGQFQSRKQGAATTGLPTATEPGKLHSSDLTEKPINPGGAPSALPPELQALHNKVAGPAGFAAKQTGWTFDGVDPQGGTKETDTSPQPALRFTDRRRGSPTEGITTYFPVDSKYPDIVKALNEKAGTKPAESGTVAPPSETKPAPTPTSRRLPSYNRPPDVLDALEATGKINIASARAIRQGYNPPKSARQYFDFSGGGSDISKALQGVQESASGNFTRLQTEEDLLDAIDKAGPGRHGMRNAASAEARAAEAEVKTNKGKMRAGPGAATRPDLVPTGPDLSTDAGNPDIHGVANRVREEMAKAGTAEHPVSGQGIAPKDSVEHGRKLLWQGVDPEQAMQNYERTGRFNDEDVAVIRAWGEQLAHTERRVEEKFGTDSDQYPAGSGGE